MSIEVSVDKGMCRTRIDGEMTIYTVNAYRQALLEQGRGCVAMEVDLAGVTEMDTAGLQLLIALSKQTAKTDTVLFLSNLSERVAEVLALTELTADLTDGQQGDGA